MSDVGPCSPEEFLKPVLSGMKEGKKSLGRGPFGLECFASSADGLGVQQDFSQTRGHFRRVARKPLLEKRALRVGVTPRTVRHFPEPF